MKIFGFDDFQTANFYLYLGKFNEYDTHFNISPAVYQSFIVYQKEIYQKEIYSIFITLEFNLTMI